MIKFVVLSVLLCSAGINGNPTGAEPNNAAAEARRVVHQTNWAAGGTLSATSPSPGFPMVTLLATADSKINNPSTGKIFFYMMESEIAAKDTKQDNKVTLMFTDAQEGKCDATTIDPRGLECGRVMISGQVKRLEPGNEEYTQAVEALQSRHPTLTGGLAGIKLYPHKLEISSILVLLLGRRGYHPVTPEQYAAA